MSRPPVLLIGNFLSRHFASRTVGEELAARLTAAGWTVTSTSEKLPRFARLLDMQRTIWTQGPFAIAQVDVYSGAAFLWAEAACWSLRRRRVPYVLTLHGGRLPEFARRKPQRVRRLLRGARAVTTPSGFLRRAMKQYRERLILLPNPLDLAAYPNTPRDRPRPRLVWLRAFHEIYRPEMAVHVLAHLARRHDDAELTMIGPDKGDGSLERSRRAAERLGIADRVRFTGWVAKKEVPGLLAKADVFLNTSDADNAPVSVTEAMACGLCVVSTDAGGVPDLVTDGDNALLVPCGDDKAMAAAVKRLIQDPELAARLSSNARHDAQERDWSHVLPAWEALLLKHATRGSADGDAGRSAKP